MESSKLNNKSWLSYDDGDVLFSDDVRKFRRTGVDAICLNQIVVFVCSEGSFSFEYMGRMLTLRQKQSCVCFPGEQLSQFTFSDDVQCLLFGFSIGAIDNVFYLGKEFWLKILSLSDNPVIDLMENEMTMLRHLYEVAKFEVRQKGHHYQKRIVRLLLQAVVYHFFEVIERCNMTELAEPEVTQGDMIFRKFLELLIESNGRVRTVHDYAKQLCVSSKYLSKVVKKASGKLPMELIHKHVTNVLVQELRYTDKSIKTIAGEMEFASIASLGKYFRSQMNMSASEYRRQFNRTRTLTSRPKWPSEKMNV